MSFQNIFGYTKPIGAFAVFIFIVYGAYTPNQNASVQRVVCVKFKAGTTEEQVQAHLHDFANLRREISEIVAYSAGKTISNQNTKNSGFEVMHYITFRSEADVKQFEQDSDNMAFVNAHQKNWEKVWTMNASIMK